MDRVLTFPVSLRRAGVRCMLVASENAGSVLDAWVALLEAQASDLVGTETIESDAATIRDFLSAD